MKELPAQQQPSSPDEHLAHWKARRRILVPTRKGGLLDMQIKVLIEATAINGIAVDAVIHARASKRAPMRIFAVVLSDKLPEGEYPIPTLWISSDESTWLN